MTMTTENNTTQESPKPTEEQEAVLTTKYRQGQFARLSEQTREYKYKPKVKFICPNGTNTNYMNITADEFAAIEKLLTKAALPPKVNILSIAKGMQNCVKVKHTNAEGADWYTIHRDRIESALLEVLPHGSGIDIAWYFDFTDKAIFCQNSYHLMNDNGFYIGWIDFQVKISINHRTIDGKIDFTISGRFGKHQDIKDHLYETIGQSLDTL